MKMRKLLITAGAYFAVTSEIVANLYAEGKSVQEIQAITGLKKSSINGYLPYSKVIYNQSEKSVGADRIGLYRKRNGLISTLQKDLSDETLWDCIIAHQDFLFHTSSGLPFKYSVKVGRNGQYTKELIIDRREESKTLSWNSIVLAFKNAVAFVGVVTKPEELGDMQAKEAAKEPDKAEKAPAKKRTSVKEKLATKKKEVDARDEKAPAKAPSKKKETCI